MKRVGLKLLFVLLLMAEGMLMQAQDHQSIVVESIVLDSVSHTPLCYVNIGIANKNIGTISGVDGKFSLSLPDSLANETVTFSMIGYSTKLLSVSELQNENRNILLSPSVIELRPAEVTAKKLKAKKIGKSSGVGVTFAVGVLEAGGEIGAVMKMPGKKKSFLKDFNFKITGNKPDSAVFRLNLYYVEKDRFTNILNDNIYFTLHKGVTGDICVDLSPYQIVVDRDILASIEFLEIYAPEVEFDEDDPNRYFYGDINIAGGFVGPKSYMRPTSQGVWEKVPLSISPCFWMTVLQ